VRSRRFRAGGRVPAPGAAGLASLSFVAFDGWQLDDCTYLMCMKSSSRKSGSVSHFRRVLFHSWPDISIAFIEPGECAQNLSRNGFMEVLDYRQPENGVIPTR
jgi:hypothetical protein